MEMEKFTTIGEIFTLKFDMTLAVNIFAFYVGALLLLAYFLSITVSSLHIRSDSVVYPLSRPKQGTYFTEYIIKLKTSLMLGSSFDERGRIIIQLIGTFADSPTLHLKQGKGIEYFLERGATNIFVYHSPYTLGDIKEITITMVNDAPHEIPFVEWKPSFIAVMQPSTRLLWSTPGKKMKCPEAIRQTFDCVPDKREKYSFFKALCLFNIWLSMIHSPIRFGTYSNFVNVLLIFYVVTALLSVVLFVELGFHFQLLEFVPEIVATEIVGAVIRLFGATVVVWVLEILFEAIFRNTVPKSSAPKFSKFRGLVEPIDPIHGLNDFTIDYDWDQVWPLVPKKRVIVPFGTRHGSAQSVFPIAPVRSYFNFWGLIGREEEREGNWFTRSINMCALPLPLTLKWLAKEAWGLKEEKLIRQYTSDFKAPMCFFCCWLQDWPLHYADNPQQAGLIFSHIICRDILSIFKLTNKKQQARLAQLCLHQWNGLISSLFLFAIKQNLDQKNKASNAVLSFIHRHLKVFGKRNPREIQAVWRKREMFLQEIQQAGEQKKFQIDEMKPTDKLDKNRSAVPPKYVFPFSAFVRLYRAMSRKTSFIEQIPGKDVFEKLDCVGDQLVFDASDRASLNSSKGRRRVKEFQLPRAKEIPSFSVIGEGPAVYQNVQPGHPVKRIRKRLLFVRHPPFAPDAYQKLESISDIKLEMEDNENENSPVSSSSNVSIVKSDSSKNDLDSDSLPQVTIVSPDSSVYSNVNYNSIIKKKGDDNNTALDLVMDKTKSKREIKEQQSEKAAAVLARKSVDEVVESSAATSDVQSLPMSRYEMVKLGSPYKEETACTIDPNKAGQFLRHRHEIIGYCCNNKRCIAAVEIHKKVSHVSFDILKKIIQDLLYFALDSKDITDINKLWKRKKLVQQVYEMMDKKAIMFANADFQELKKNQEEGFLCNQLITTCLTMLEVMVDVVQVNKDESFIAQLIARRKKFGVRPKTIHRCSYCARKLKNNSLNTTQGCDDMEKLVKFFCKDTIYVSEREIHIEMTYKVTIQNYCAMMVNVAKKDVMNELEDPPMVLTTKVTRAMICLILSEMLPKHTSFKDMTADELRRLGTRRERIQARHDPKFSQRETPEQKKRKQMIQTIMEDLSNRWRVNVKENELHYCAMLLAQCLVQERILGLSLYSGLISEEHEDVLDCSRSRLGEVEKKSYNAILKVARKILLPRLKKAIDSAQDMDVLFTRFRMEANYTAEVVNVVQFLSESAFIKTCCFYIDDIVEIKMAEFQEFAAYLISMEPMTELNTRLKLKMLKAKYKIDEPFEEQNVKYNYPFSSPILRWGTTAIKGVPALPPELKYSPEIMKLDEILPKIHEVAAKNENMENITSKVLKARRKLKGFLDLNAVEKKRKLESHLGRVQANLIEQITLASQNISDTYTQETDFQREYHRDELFNVEFYATYKLQVPFCSAMGILLIILMILLTLFMMFFVTFKTSYMELSYVKVWFLHCFLAFLLHFFLFEPFKCFLYSLLGLYID